MDLSVIPECYVDTNLIETIAPPLGRYNHQKGCGTVAKVMKERFSDDFALGIIDKDKNQLDYLKEFDVVHSSGNLFLHKHKTKHHYFIQISPAVERFILSAIDTANLNLEDYGLPSSIDALKKVTKSTNSKEDYRFKNLFRDLKHIGGTELDVLAAWVSHIKDNRYNVDLDFIKQA